MKITHLQWKKEVSLTKTAYRLTSKYGHVYGSAYRNVECLWVTSLLVHNRFKTLKEAKLDVECEVAKRRPKLCKTFKFRALLKAHTDACQPAVQWVGGKTLTQSWQLCQNPGWMLWLVDEVGIDARRVHSRLTHKAIEQIKEADYMDHARITVGSYNQIRSKKVRVSLADILRGMVSVQELEDRALDMWCSSECYQEI